MEAPSLAGKRVLVMGLGIKDGGTEMARLAAREGAAVTVTDLQDRAALAASINALAGLPISYRLGGHDPADFDSVDVLLKNEAVPASNPFVLRAVAAGARVDTQLGLFFNRMPDPFLAVTGTKGKTFTTHLVAHLLDRLDGGDGSGARAVAAGNNCVSPLRFLHDDPRPVFALELSSWQLRDMAAAGRAPRVACWTSFFADHLNHYGSMDDYFADKRLVTDGQGPEDFLVVPADDPRLRDLPTKARKLLFAADRAVDDGCFLRAGRVVLRLDGIERELAALDGLPPPFDPPHFVPLLLAALATVAAWRGGLTAEETARALAGFAGIPHRMETVFSDDAGTWINDSAATTPESALLAVAAARRPLLLIAGGGGHKNLDHAGLAAALPGAVDRLVLFRDDATSDRLAAALGTTTALDIVRVAGLDGAVAEGARFLAAHPGGTVLLSPACAGAPFFPDLYARGDRFRAAVRAVAAARDRTAGA